MSQGNMLTVEKSLGNQNKVPEMFETSLERFIFKHGANI